MNDNNQRLRMLMAMLGLSIADVARVIGVSRPLVSRVLANDPGVRADDVFMKIERHLPDLVAMRKRPMFDLRAAPIPENAVQASLSVIEAKTEVAA